MTEYSDEYQKVFADGIESFRPDFKHITTITCDGCINVPVDGENYPYICITCRRFYPDNFEFKA